MKCKSVRDFFFKNQSHSNWSHIFRYWKNIYFIVE